MKATKKEFFEKAKIALRKYSQMSFLTLKYMKANTVCRKRLETYSISFDNRMHAYRYPDERFTPYQDAAAAIQNLLLMGEYLGIGACWCTYTSYSSIRREREIRKLLHIPDHMLICGAVPLGWPRQNMCVVPRDENSQLYLVDRFGEGGEVH